MGWLGDQPSSNIIPSQEAGSGGSPPRPVSEACETPDPTSEPDENTAMNKVITAGGGWTFPSWKKGTAKLMEKTPNWS